MKQKPNASGHIAKRTVIESILLRHNQKTHPVDRETLVVIVTLAFRVIEDIWTSVSAREAFKTICSDPHPHMPNQEDPEFGTHQQERASGGRWAKRKPSRARRIQ